MATKTVLITGATRGIGLKFVELYMKLGWNVVGAARDLATADQLKALSPYKIVQLDSASEVSILSAAKELDGEAIDLLINNAGIFSRNDVTTTTKEEMMQKFEVNSVGPFLVTRAFTPHLKAAVATNGAAYVVQISSYMGSIQLNDGIVAPGCYAYRASKAALGMINASLAIDLKGDGIAAIVLHPGYVITDINDHTGEIDTDTSVNSMIKVIDQFTIADTGKFYSYTGAILPW